jgi:hypothetical protein
VCSQQRQFCQAARNVRGDVRTLEGAESVPLLRKVRSEIKQWPALMNDLQIQDSFSARAFVKLSDGVLDVVRRDRSNPAAPLSVALQINWDER